MKTEEFAYKDGFLYDGAWKRYVGKVSLIDGHLENMTDVFGYYIGKNNHYVMFITDSERGLAFNEMRCSSKEELMEKMEKFIERENFINEKKQILDDYDSITPDIIMFLRTAYGHTRRQAEDTIKYMKQSEAVAFEFAYYVKHRDFIPDRFAYYQCGYSVKDLFEKTTLTLLGSFNYMIYLKRSPDDAVTNLEMKLPRK